MIKRGLTIFNLLRNDKDPLKVIERSGECQHQAKSDIYRSNKMDACSKTG